MIGESAKVVVWQWRYICLEEWQPCTEEFAQAIKSDVRCETRALIPLTDHEAALAEERELRISLESSWQQAEAQVFALIEKHATLLTGLEALAGEWDTIADVKFKRHNKQKGIVNNFTDHDKGEVYEDCAEQLRTLASAGLEGKADG